MPTIKTHQPFNRNAKKHQRKDSTVKERQNNRQYATNDRRWRRLRAVKLSMNPLCELCKSNGKIIEARVVDHIDGDAYNNTFANLQSLCTSCHSRKTAAQDGGFGNTRKR